MARNERGLTSFLPALGLGLRMIWRTSHVGAIAILMVDLRP